MYRLETTIVGNDTTNVETSETTVNRLRATGGVVTQVATTNVSTTPTDAEITTAFGTAASVGAGFLGTIDDNGAGTAMFICVSDGTNWHFVARLTKAL